MIDVQLNGRVVHLVITAPPVNVMDAAVFNALSSKINAYGADSSISAILISGAGKCFSAGASVEEHRKETARSMIEGLFNTCFAIADAPVPVVALVHGMCLGGAMEVVAFCDFVVADPGATFGQPEIKLGFFPPVACVRLPRLTGLQNATYSILSGENIPAQRALEMGIAQKMLAQDEWDQISKMFNGLSGAALRMNKKAMGEAGGSAIRAKLEHLKVLFLSDLYDLEDVEEGICSFAERRKPEWKHR